jgi:hypothetical protein
MPPRRSGQRRSSSRTSPRSAAGEPAAAPETWQQLCMYLYGGASAAVVLAALSGLLSFGQSAFVGILVGTICTLLPAGRFGGAPAPGGSRLGSTEYRLHIFWIVWVMLYVCYHTHLALGAACAASEQCHVRLHHGIFEGTTVDTTDAQWRFFRDNLPVRAAFKRPWRFQ